jgi:hypothetical protein
MISKAASGRKKGVSMIYADVSRAYLYAKAMRTVYVQLPEEDMEEGDESRCGKLMTSMHGTRDAALNWALEYGETLKAAGYEQGRANPCLFQHRELNVSVMVHGDDFVAVGPDKHLDNIKKTLSDKYKIKIEQLGHGGDKKPEIRILNKVVRMTDTGIELEADPRHAELVISELGLSSARPSMVPGSKTEGRTATSTDVPRKGSTQARIDVQDSIDNIQNATMSMKGDSWNSEVDDGLEVDDDNDDSELDADGARSYRAIAARLNYISPDRPDIGYAVKEAARNMSKPRVSDFQKLRKIGRYLVGKPRLITRFPWQSTPDRIIAFTDSDWAGCAKSAKSTSGGAICLGEHTLKTYCKQQKVIALSSAEAELYAMVAASAEALAI